MTPTESAALTQQTGWTPRQRNHLRRLMREGAIIAYWCSDAHGRPANHEMEPLQACDWTARPGLVQEVAGPLATCSSRALHATMEPHLWAGVRVWLVGLVGQVRTDQDAKMGALRREIVGEIFPESAFSASVGVRIGRRDLVGASLDGASLDRASLDGASLVGASLVGASLVGASLDGASLVGAYRPHGDLPDGWIRSPDGYLTRAT